ncbi:mannose-6-phosphate isomerase, type 1 [Alkalibacterium subtropicum]|uniref:Mannose-6-phosphate isomerase n=1 Tax=Alkalibacterium subtropicum TaxID=753702 RepID=A0A1I1HQ14_9LACT|nr:mannose-6-phosphate isomerase, class I [Alkalibacterium subtropicum]SFC25946.1 mannose-6-phosphate isomerase, type 1 [Alkalibacterium subtropicum]
MTEPLFLSGVFKEKIWGGEQLKALFDYAIPSERTGEMWAISAHTNGPSTVQNGPFKGKQLDELWSTHKELFGNAEGDVFPLLTKIIDAQTDLSVQVHPDDVYGKEHEGELGKTECWYIIEAEEGSEIVYGHHAQTKEELESMIANGQWDQLLRRKEVKAGDFFYVPSGTIHAIGGGIVILETQQSSDTTYRVYDYDRVQDNGEKRDLHIEDSVAVTTVPHIDPDLEMASAEKDGYTETTLVSNAFFTVKEWRTDGKASFKKDAPYTLVSVLDGQGELIVDGMTYSCSKGDHFILPSSIESWDFDGPLHMIASHPGQ